MLRDFLLLLLAAVAAYALHTLVVIPALLAAVTRRNPYTFLLRFRAAHAKAFRTGSSEEALDATVEAAVESGELSAAVAGAWAGRSGVVGVVRCQVCHHGRAGGRLTSTLLPPPRSHTGTAGFVLPLGIDLNLDGAGIYYPLAVLYLGEIGGYSGTVTVGAWLARAKGGASSCIEADFTL